MFHIGKTLAEGCRRLDALASAFVDAAVADRGWIWHTDLTGTRKLENLLGCAATVHIARN